MYSIHCCVIYCTCILFSVLRSIDASHLIVNPLFSLIRYIVQYPLLVVSDFDLERNNINNSSFRRCVPYNKLQGYDYD